MTLPYSSSPYDPYAPFEPTREQGPPRRQPPQPTGSLVGLWGAPSSGKTTMLAVLQSAINLQSGGDRNWIMFAGDEETRSFLDRIRGQLASRKFPAASPYSSRPLVLRMIRPEPSWLLRLLGRSTRREFQLNVLDVSGILFGREAPPMDDALVFDTEEEAGAALFEPEPVSAKPLEQLVDHLARADGMLYLFDPVRELENQNSYLFLETMLERVLQRAEALGRLADGRLPHYLAVCINKIDDPRVFNRAYDDGLLGSSSDDLMLPEMTSEDAKLFFEQLCTGRGAGSGPWVRGSIDAHFHSGRVRYFATSSVGFYIGPSGTFRTWDFNNVELTGGQARLRGPVRPMNVLEPLLWLEESIRQARPVLPSDERPLVGASGSRAGRRRPWRGPGRRRGDRRPTAASEPTAGAPADPRMAPAPDVNGQPADLFGDGARS